jgi:hypothetical protein
MNYRVYDIKKLELLKIIILLKFRIFKLVDLIIIYLNLLL